MRELAVAIVCGVVIWLVAQLFLAIGPAASWIVVLSLGLLVLVLTAMWQAWKHGIRPRWRIRAVRRHVVKIGVEPRYVLGVEFDAVPRDVLYLPDTASRGQLCMVFEERSRLSKSLELWHRSGRSVIRIGSVDLARLVRADVSPGGGAGTWFDLATMRLWFTNIDDPLVVKIRGNQKGSLELPWQLDADARLRRARALRRSKRMAAKRAREALPRPQSKASRRNTQI